MPRAKVIKNEEGTITVIVRRGYREEKLQGRHSNLQAGDIVLVKRVVNNPYLVLDPVDPTMYPTLCRLLDTNDVQYFLGEYIGTASDGIDVTFGMDGDESSIESYLSDHPSPSEW